MRKSVTAGVLLTLLLPVSLAAQTPQATASASTPPDQKIVLQGRVVSSQSGEPLRKATVHLRRRNQATGAVPGAQAYTGTSEADGSFRFEAVEPGEYNLSGERFGFLNSQYGQKDPSGAGTPLTFRAGQQITDLILKLTPQAVISGKVVDEDGDPINNAMIQVLSQRWMRGKLRYMPSGGNGTNDRGEFRIANLEPGKYYICAEKRDMNMPGNEAPAIPGKPEIRHVRTYFPDATSMQSAAPLEIKAGQDLTGIDIHLRSAQTYHVRGRIAGDVSGGDSERSMLTMAPQQDEFPTMMMGRSTVNKDGTFDLSGIAPGSYMLTLLNMGNGGLHGLARQPIEVGAGDVSDVVLNIVPPSSLSGRIQIDGTPPASASPANLTRVRIRLTSVGPILGGPLPNTVAGTDGTFNLENVSPGKYYCQVSGGPDGSYLKSVRFGQQEMLGKEIDLSQGASGEFEITFRYGAAEVDGVVQQTQTSSGADSSNAQPAAIPSASIILTPDVLNTDGSGMLFGSTNQTGVFSIKQVPPGHYRAYAFEQMNMNQLQNPDILKQLESKGTEVEVKENDKKQIPLSVISIDDMHQILARLGMDSK